MYKLIDFKVHDLVIKTQDKTSRPGGGSLCALTGALSGSLMVMVDQLSKDQALEDRAKVQDLVSQLEDMVEKDSQAFQRVLNAYKLPRDTEEEKAHYKSELEEGYHEAIASPLNICETILRLMEIQGDMVDKAHTYAVSDLKVAASLAYGALEGASFMVETNLGGVKEEDARAYKAEIKEILNKGLELKKEIIYGK